MCFPMVSSVARDACSRRSVGALVSSVVVRGGALVSSVVVRGCVSQLCSSEGMSCVSQCLYLVITEYTGTELVLS